MLFGILAGATICLFRQGVDRMDRRRFLDAAARGAAAAAWAGSSLGTGRRLLGAGADRPKLIIPTDIPDRFKVKVMEFNPVPPIDAARWDLEMGGLAGRPPKLKLADIKRLPRVKQSSRLTRGQCWY